ncbi:MAG: S1C family serine protease [Nitrospinota bacterium]
MVKKAAPQLIAKGYVSHTYLGVRMYPLFPDFAKAMDMKIDKGVVVASVSMGTPADKAGIKGGNRQVRIGNTTVPVGGDVIVEVEGKPVETPQQVVSILSAKEVGDRVKIKLWREGEYRTITVTLGERPR